MHVPAKVNPDLPLVMMMMNGANCSARDRKYLLTQLARIITVHTIHVCCNLCSQIFHIFTKVSPDLPWIMMMNGANCYARDYKQLLRQLASFISCTGKDCSR